MHSQRKTKTKQKQNKKKKKKKTDDILHFVSDLFQKTGFGISCKLSPKCQTPLSDKISSNCCLLNLP